MLHLPLDVYKKLESAKFKPLNDYIFSCAIHAYSETCAEHYNRAHWGSIIDALTSIGIKLDHFSLQVLNQIFQICLENFPGYRFLDNDEDNSCPYAFLRETFENVYKTPYNFKLLKVERPNKYKDKPVYFSLHNPHYYYGQFNALPSLSTRYQALERLAYTISRIYELNPEGNYFLKKVNCLSTFKLREGSYVNDAKKIIKDAEKGLVENSIFFSNCIQVSIT